MVRELGNFSTRQGGDRRSGRIEAYAELILNAVTAAPDITLAELRAMLKDEGLTAACASIWRFFERRKRCIVNMCLKRFLHMKRHGVVRRCVHIYQASNLH